MLYDITPAITPDLQVWPGDSAPTREVFMDTAKGDNITLSTIRMTCHTGAHADGPNHYGKDAPGIGERPLTYYLGPCEVVTANVKRGERITAEHLATPIDDIRAHRVLFKTGTFPDPCSWNENFAALSVELVDALAGKAVMTVGIDTPSVDLFHSKDLEAHQAILRHDMAILEGLRLEHVPDGVYELIALPLKLLGHDGSPVRAVLRSLTDGI